MRLSVFTVTNASPDRLEPWILRALDVADELIVTLDARVDPASIALARELADVVAIAELPGIGSPAYSWTAAQATGDWVLMLDDELLAPGFADRLPELMADRRYSHYHLPMRWLVTHEGGGHRWIRQFSWWPNRATRLFRNVDGLARHSAEAHGSWEVFGEGRALEGPDFAIYHLDLALRDRAAREAKVAARYRRDGPEVATCEEYYVYEDYLATIELAHVPPGVIGAPPTERASGRAAERRRTAGQRPAPVDVTAGDLFAHIAERSADPPIWGAQYLGHDTPARLAANRGHTTSVTVRNTSAATWRSLGQVVGRVLLSYRWFTEEGQVVIPQGDISLLPHALHPGEQATVTAGLWTPPEPGTYRLEWDMLCERIAWFSVRGVEPLRVTVEVVDDGPRPQAPHFPPGQPAAAPEPAEPPEGRRGLRTRVLAGLRTERAPGE